MEQLMYYIYVLKSSRNGQLYIGMTKRLRERLQEHNSGQNKSTKAFTPYKLMQTTDNRRNTRLIEKKFKSGYFREKFK